MRCCQWLPPGSLHVLGDLEPLSWKHGFQEHTIRANKARTSFCRMTQLNIYQERTYNIFIYIFKWVVQQKDVRASFPPILSSWNQTSNTTMLNTWLFISGKIWYVTFVNLLENQQTPLYCTLYRGYYYRLPNQFTIKENLWYIEKFNTTKTISV